MGHSDKKSTLAGSLPSLHFHSYYIISRSMKEECTEHPLYTQPSVDTIWIQRRRCTLWCNGALAKVVRDKIRQGRDLVLQHSPHEHVKPTRVAVFQ